ncbi:MAG: hypothetical protein E5W93_10280 [Mesorhizobium sp.]|nr:MAG: hypothetical protein E5W93_10280 [Mesorhizobium sp.]
MRAPKDHPAQLTLFDELGALDASAADRPDAAQGVLGRRPSAVATMPPDAVICAGCGAPFSPNRPDRRCCSASCRKRLERRRKRDTVVSPGESVTQPPGAASAAVPRVETPPAGSVSRLTPCARPGYPPGLFESVDSDGSPIFFDADGDRLFRVWGPNRLSAVELRTMKLGGTEFGFPGGHFYRKEVV